MLLIPILLLVFALPAHCFQATDISGIWAGKAEIPGTSKTDQITLILEKRGDSYSGILSDTLGLAKNVPLENVAFKNDNLRFKVTIKSDGKDIKLSGGLNFLLGELIGGWGIDTGEFGAVDLARTKQTSLFLSPGFRTGTDDGKS
jgi:hypothetical protein